MEWCINMNSKLFMSALLTAFFVFASSIKIIGWQKAIFEIQLAFFKKYGLNRTLMAVVGGIEFFGAVTIWLPGILGLVGAAALFATSAGAIFFHLRFDTWKDGVPAMLTLLLSGALVVNMLLGSS